ncbi:hypothetical protein BWI93_05770 [Siphonobacter sp. BAB-5385]|uniref:hypothetical protein n=1 Tax=Siphonobacter sp. BAB-5385 TaxID=1864822 RepID=UPI000B9E997C|nr:hypothetical protein [Siphonobacter sp. BAB-5385]OZI09136.1 hypothetical protein BWI93_05770 [Siphonobacter sp. BAB-5385]
MKFYLLLLSLFCIHLTPASAQLPAGTKLRGIRPTLTTQNVFLKNPSTTHHTSDISLELTYGKFIRENVAHGWSITPGFGINSEVTSWLPQLKINYFNRRYVPVTSGIYAFAEGTVGVQSQLGLSSGNYYKNPFLQSYSAFAALNAGLTYFYKNDWALEAEANLGTLSVSHLRSKPESQSTAVSLESSLSAQLFTLGITRYIGSGNSKSTIFETDHNTPYTAGQRYWEGRLSSNFNFIKPSAINSSNSQSINIGFSTARFVSDKQARGFGLSAIFSNLNAKSELYPPSSMKFGGATAFIFREHYLPLGKKLSLIGSVYLTGFYTMNRTKHLEQNTTEHSLDINPSIRPAIQYQLTDRWAVTAHIGTLSIASANLTLDKQKDYSNEPVNRFQTGLSFSPAYTIGNSGISFRYFPGR